MVSSWRDRLIIVFRATRQHATRLASFVALYKMLLLLQRKANGGVQRRADTFFAGLLGGYTVFGDRNAINEQVCP
jgi:peroxisomal membrane protein 4